MTTQEIINGIIEKADAKIATFMPTDASMLSGMVADYIRHEILAVLQGRYDAGKGYANLAREDIPVVIAAVAEHYFPAPAAEQRFEARVTLPAGVIASKNFDKYNDAVAWVSEMTQGNACESSAWDFDVGAPVDQEKLQHDVFCHWGFNGMFDVPYCPALSVQA